MQPYRVVMIGEKSSLADVLGPIAQGHEADLYLPTGEMSDTLVYRIARTAAKDGRPLAVLYFADCDPAGWQMPISVGRKLQAFRELLGGFDFELHRVALTPDQVREYGLPSTPLKDTEKRGDAWRRETGTAADRDRRARLAAPRPATADRPRRRRPVLRLRARPPGRGCPPRVDPRIAGDHQPRRGW